MTSAFQNLFSHLLPQTVEKVSSPANGEITVIADMGKFRLNVGGLTQSGDLIERIWSKPLKFLKNEKLAPKTCLVLGLGGGTVAHLLVRLWPRIVISGIEIDPLMVALGRKYLGLDSIPGLRIIIGEINQEINKSTQKYDLILFDVYKGDQMENVFLNEITRSKLLAHLEPDGALVVNALFYTVKTRLLGEKIVKLLEAEKKITLLRELTNLLIVAR